MAALHCFTAKHLKYDSKTNCSVLSHFYLSGHVSHFPPRTFTTPHHAYITFVDLSFSHGALIARLNYISREKTYHRVALHGRTNLPCLLHSLSLFRHEDLIKRLDELPVDHVYLSFERRDNFMNYLQLFSWPALVKRARTFFLRNGYLNYAYLEYSSVLDLNNHR